MALCDCAYTKGKTKKILVRGSDRPALCDHEDYELLAQFDWELSADGRPVAKIEGEAPIYMDELVLTHIIAHGGGIDAETGAIIKPAT